jgi:hypothetical protein
MIQGRSSEFNGWYFLLDPAPLMDMSQPAIPKYTYSDTWPTPPHAIIGLASNSSTHNQQEKLHTNAEDRWKTIRDLEYLHR